MARKKNIIIQTLHFTLVNRLQTSNYIFVIYNYTKIIKNIFKKVNVKVKLSNSNNYKLHYQNCTLKNTITTNHSSSCHT